MSDPAFDPTRAPRPAGCTCFRLRRLSRRVSRLYDARLAPHGLRVTQFSLLSTLAAGDPPATLGALAERMEMDRTTLTRNLRPLLAQGLLAIEAGADPRARSVRLTDAGRALQRSARPAWRSAQQEIESLLGTEPLSALHAGLDAALARLHAAS